MSLACGEVQPHCKACYDCRHLIADTNGHVYKHICCEQREREENHACTFPSEYALHPLQSLLTQSLVVLFE